jgi:acyl-CoA thioester hydrolase
LRHSAYADYAAQSRVEFLEAFGLTMDKMAEWGIGPVLFREESKYYREIRATDVVTLRAKLMNASADGRKFSFQTEFILTSGTLAATVDVDGAWFDVATRRITAPPAEALALLPPPQANPPTE